MTDVGGAGGGERRRLRFAVLVDAESLPQWQLDCLRALRASGVADLVSVVQHDPAAAATVRRSWLRHCGYYLLRICFMRPACWREAAATAEFSGAERLTETPVHDGGSWCRLSERTLDRLNSQQLDFILRFGFNLLRGPVLELPRLGVWSFHHGDPRRYRGRPALFWELLHGTPTAGVMLQRLSAALDGGAILREGQVQLDGWSLSRSLQRLYTSGATFPVAVCRQYLAAGELTQHVLQRAALGPNYRLPGNLQVLQLLLKLAVRLLRHLWRGAFAEKRWTLGWSEHWRLDQPPAQRQWNWLPPLGARGFLADPCVVPGSSMRTVLCEWMDYRKGYGVIAAVDLAEPAGTITPRVLIDDRRHHHSYPFVFADSGRLYCAPEAAATGRLWLHELAPNAATVLGSQVMLPLAALDPTLCRHDGRWWLFCTHEGSGSLSQLQLYHAQQLTGPWTPHPANPVVTDVRGARPAGALFIENGVLYRPGQDCSIRYGGAIAVYRVETLTTTAYREVLQQRIEAPGVQPAMHGVHTLSLGAGGAVIDGYTEVFTPLAWLNRLRLWWRRRR